VPVTLRPLGALVHRIKLRTRVLVGVLVVTLIVLAGFGYTAANALHGYLLTQTDSNLRAVLNEYKTLILKTGGLPRNPGAGEIPRWERLKNTSYKLSSDAPLFQVPAVLDTYYIELTGNHRPTTVLVGGNNNLVPSLQGVVAEGAHTMTSANGRGQLRVLAEPVGSIGMLVVTTSLTSLNSTASRLQLIVIIGSLAAALVVVAGVGLVVRRGLRPVERMAAAGQDHRRRPRQPGPPVRSGDRGGPPRGGPQRDAGPHRGRRPRAGGQRGSDPAVLRRR
jgi:hypothetical protein